MPTDPLTPTLPTDDVTTPAETDQLLVDAEGLIDALREDRLGGDPEIEAVPYGALRPVEVDPCPVCGVKWAFERYVISGTDFRLVACTDCGLGSLYPQPSVLQLNQWYSADYYGGVGEKFSALTEKMVRQCAEWSADRLTHGLPPSARALDVGCGRGVLLEALSRRGCESHGFEISRTAAAGAEKHGSIRIAPRLESAGYDDEQFDLVVMWHVLEHLRSPRETLSEVRRLLKPGGRLAVAVPNFASLQSRWFGAAWFHLDLPRHMFHFAPWSLRRLLESSGFACRKENHFSLCQNPFGWVQSALNRIGCRRNSLYASLKSGANRPRLFRRIALKTGYLTGMPVGLVLSVIAASCRSGATISLIAERSDDATEDRSMDRRQVEQLLTN